MAEADLYNSLLFFFEYHPYNNFLHQRVCEIFTLGLNSNNEGIINHFLYQTSLVRRILGSSLTLSSAGNDSTGYILHQSSSSRVQKGFVIFMRKIANKMIEMARVNEELASFLESIPEWADYADGELKKANELHTRPLGQDTKQRKKSHF